MVSEVPVIGSPTVPFRSRNSMRLSGIKDWVWPKLVTAARLTFMIASLPFIILPALLPLSSLLLMMPAVLPDETVITETNRKGSDLTQSLLKRLFNLCIGVACLIALVVGANELTWWMRLTGPLRWMTTVVLVYMLDLAILAAIGKVPLRYNIRNLIVRWRITILTAVAFTVVVALLTTMLAFVNGMYRVVEDSGQPANILILADGSTDEVFSNLGYGDVDLIETQRCTQDENGQPLAEFIGVKKTEVNGRTLAMASRETYAIPVQQIPHLNKKRFVQVRGIVEPEISGSVHDLALLSGRWFSAAGVQTPAGAKPGERDQIEAVLGAGVAREFGKTSGKDTLRPGDTFDLADRTWAVVGIMNSDGTTFGSEVWAKQDLVAKQFNKTGYNSMVIRVDDHGSRDEVSRRAALMAYHLRNRFSNPKVNAQTETEYFSKQSETNRQFLVAIIVIAAVMALGGMCGVMNTMFAAISQRTKDIGVMRIIGFKRWQMLVSFLLESLGIALIGGLAGLAIGSLTHGLSATSSISSGQGGGKTVILRLVVDAQVLMAGLMFIFVMGRLGGLIPALNAMRLKLLESLR
jgi:ABC-type antimicrobial peptide transport system permease subunit